MIIIDMYIFAANRSLCAASPLTRFTFQGKGSNWEGGTRVPAFVTGGFLPASMRGKTLEGPVHVADW